MSEFIAGGGFYNHRIVVIAVVIHHPLYVILSTSGKVFCNFAFVASEESGFVVGNKSRLSKIRVFTGVVVAGFEIKEPFSERGFYAGSIGVEFREIGAVCIHSHRAFPKAVVAVESDFVFCNISIIAQRHFTIFKPIVLALGIDDGVLSSDGLHHWIPVRDSSSIDVAIGIHSRHQGHIKVSDAGEKAGENGIGWCF